MVKVLAVASGGGHWDQLMMLRDAFNGHEMAYATTDLDQARARQIDGAHLLPDCNLRRPLESFWCLLCSVRLLLRLRPERVITTGAAPGLFCLLAGRLMGSRTLWIDSVANAERLSLSGRMALKISHKCLTQWENLESDAGPFYAGSVL